MAEKLIILEPDKYYHIYNHAVGKENFFESDSDFNVFLEKFIKYPSPICDVLTYCLMPNHLHFLVRIKNELRVMTIVKKPFLKNYSHNIVSISKNDILTDIISKQFSHLFNSYAKYYNYTHHRKGTLFSRAFRRKLIDSDDYLKQLICYIHQNPVNAGLCRKPDEWKYSSYNALVNLKDTLVCRNEVIALFDDVDNFKFCNQVKVDIKLDFQE